jgi:hypothetical protein
LSARPTLESRMAHISGFARDQLLLLPEAVDDYVDAENPVRFIDAFVDGLDLCGGGVCAGRGEGDGAAGLRAGRSAEALHLGLPQPGPIEPTAGARVSLQRRDHRVAWRLEA